MQGNAAGPWRAFSADDPKTWPESSERYKVRRRTRHRRPIFVQHTARWDKDYKCFWDGDWAIANSSVTHYARILPPGESPEEGK